LWEILPEALLESANLHTSAQIRFVVICENLWTNASRYRLTANDSPKRYRVVEFGAVGERYLDCRAGAGLAASFARAMADKNKDVKIGLIPCAVGGTRIDRWVEGGDLWSNAVKRARIALKSGKLKGILWHQGESDATSKLAPKWGAKFESMIKSFRRELGDVPFIAGELGGYLETYKNKKVKRVLWREINALLHALEGKIKDYRVVPSEGLTPNRDNLHFNTESLRAFGLRYAEAFDSIK
jgi:hypothetical protein